MRACARSTWVARAMADALLALNDVRAGYGDAIVLDGISRGAVVWRGRDITRVAPHWRARAGLGWVAQEREIFPSLSVEENLVVGSRPGRWDLKAVYDLFPRLNERRASAGNHLSGGE